MALFFLAIAAGFLTILAPCILPILPFLLASGAGRSRLRPLVIVGTFVLSFSIIGGAFATAGSFLGISNDSFRIVAGIILILFGTALLFESAYDRLMVRVQPLLAQLGTSVAHGANMKTDALSGVLVGLSLGLIWSPCAGPILGTIITLASQTKDTLTTTLLFFAYAVGAGIPMLAIAYGSRAMQLKFASFGKAQPILNKIFGILVILTAIAILTGYDRVIQTRIIDAFPWSTGLIKL